MPSYAVIKRRVEQLASASLPYAKIKTQIERIQTPKKILIGNQPLMVIGGPEIRIGQYTDLFDKVKKRVEKKVA